MGIVRLLFRLIFGKPKRRQARRETHWERPAPSVWQHGDQRRPSVERPPPQPQSVIVGRCWVIDGDTIDVNGTRIRLAGIDAPELGDPYGNKAKFHLLQLCRDQQVRAVFDGQQSYERAVATCFLSDGRDLSAEMVKAGLALDWKKFSGGKYREMETPDARKRLWRCDARQRGKMPQSLPD